MTIVRPNDYLCSLSVTFSDVVHQPLQRLRHMGISDVPGVDVFVEHATIIFFGVLDHQRVHFSNKLHFQRAYFSTTFGLTEKQK